MGSWVSHFHRPPASLTVLGMNADGAGAQPAGLGRRRARPQRRADAPVRRRRLRRRRLLRVGRLPRRARSRCSPTWRGSSGPAASFVCTFSNRCFPTKAIRGWLATDRRPARRDRRRVLPPAPAGGTSRSSPGGRPPAPRATRSSPYGPRRPTDRVGSKPPQPLPETMEVEMELPQPGPNRAAGEPAVPRGHDVRRVGQPGPRRRRSRSSTPRSTPASTSSTPPTCTRPVSPRRSSARRSSADATRSCWRPSCSASMGRGPEQSGGSRHWIIKRVRGQPAPPRHRPHRPVPGPPARARHGHRRDARRAVRPGPPGQGPLPRQLDVPGVGDRRGPVGGRAPRTASGSCASSRRTRCSCAASRPKCCRRASATGWA